MSAVTDQLTKLGVTYEVISHEQAYTSIDEALALGISADEVVKTIVLDTTAGHALAVILGSRRLDVRAAQRAVGAKHVRLAVRWSSFEGGGHYAAHKAPDLLVGDVREFFRDLR